MQQVYVNCNDMEWEPAKNYPAGTMIKLLRDFDDRKTAMLKLPAGVKMDAHSHTVVEQHYVLEGQYEIEGQVYGEGSYQLIPPGFTHGPFYVKESVVLLVIWDPHKE